MLPLLIRIVLLILVGLMTGTVCCIWIGLSLNEFSYPTYLALHQQLINALNTLMPLLGLVTILLTFWYAALERQKSKVIALCVAGVLLIISGLITRFGNQPINEIVMTWSPNTPPDNWMVIRGRWLSLHQFRSLTMLLAFCIITGVSVKK